MPLLASPRNNAIEAGPGRLDPSRFTPANRRRLSGPGLRTFLTICDLWGLTELQRRLILGLPSRSIFNNLAKAVREHRDIVLDVDVLTRISAVLGIHKALGLLHNDEREAVAWLRSKHRAVIFGGHAPLDLIVSGTQDGLLTVRRFLDAACSGLYVELNALDRAFSPYLDADVVFV